MENDFVKILEDFVEKSKTNEKPISEEFESDNEIIEEQLDEKYDNDYETQLQEMESEYNNLKEKYIRQVAEFDNFRKRTLKEKEELRQNGHQKAVETLFPIIDDFERALNNISDEAKEGVQLIYNKFISTLQTLGIEPIIIEKNVTSFDTDIHDAITMVNVDNEELKGKVIDCVQTGYKLNGKVIRHPKVVVGNFN
jgi:molecular chaperone GrpE